MKYDQLRFSLVALFNSDHRSRIRQKWVNSSISSPPRKTGWIYPSLIFQGTVFSLASFPTVSFPDHPQAQDNRYLQDGHLLLLSPRRARTTHLRLPRGEEERVRSRLL